MAEQDGVRSFGHGGSHAGYRSTVRYFPDLQASVVILANVESALAGMWQGKIAQAFFGNKDVRTQSPERLNRQAFPQELRSAMLGTDALAQAASGAPSVVVVQGSPDGLLLTFDQQPPIEAHAVADGVFRLGTSQPVSLLTFDLADDGTIKHLKVERAARVRYVKQPAQPNLEQLRACVGAYWSEELETRYNVTLRGDHLVIEIQRHGATEMSQVGQDQFQAGGWIFGTVRLAP